MPLNPDVQAFLMKLPCVRCRCKAETLMRMDNGHDLPLCIACYDLPLPENTAKLERLAHQLNLLTGDVMTCTAVIIRISPELFPQK